MKYTNAKYIAAAVATSGIALTSMAGSCFADYGYSEVYLVAPATAIDFTVTNTYMTGTENSTDTTVEDVTITNNLSAAPIYLQSIFASGANGYTLVNYTDDFGAYATDSKMFALAITSMDNIDLGYLHDMSIPFFPNQPIAANGNVVYGLTGKASLSSTALNNELVGNLEITVSADDGSDPGWQQS